MKNIRGMKVTVLRRINRLRKHVTIFSKKPAVVRINRALVQLQRTVATPRFAIIYAITGAVILLASTVYWARLGAGIQQNNADQLVNSMLFEKPPTFRDATFPSSHSFLLKWPLFLLVKLFGYSPAAYTNLTIATVLVTISLFVLLLYRIERRPMVFGTICLALASVLMLVPAESYPGALLPVNMAMLATRNLEYIVFIYSMLLVVRRPRIRSWQFWAGVILLGILVASDKLFLSLAIGGGLLALVVYSLANGWNIVKITVRWVTAGVLAAVAAIGMVWLLNARGVTHIGTQAAIGPYGFIGTARDFALGVTYSGLHILTNFGANPAAQTMILRDIPQQLVGGLLKPYGISYIINLLLLAFSIFAAWHLVLRSLHHNRDKEHGFDTWSKLAVQLLWSSAAAVGVFAATNHYYAGDARYLTLSMFGLIIAATVYLRTMQFRPVPLALIGLTLAIGTSLGMVAAHSTAAASRQAYSPDKQRNLKVVAALKQHATETLVGDYWRVVPIKQLTGGKQSVMPLEDCTRPRKVLSSKQWQPDLGKRRFAYLLSFEKGLTGYPACSLDTVIAAYGRPNASVIIDGSVTNPRGMVLFYDRGAQKSAPIFRLNTPSTILPVDLADLPRTSCRQPTTMNIVAHEDDDLLFMNPDITDEIKAGNCIRTIYMTAGDAGTGNDFYWLGREQGSQAAYSKMLGFNDIWVQRVVRLGNGKYATIANPRGNEQVCLIFLRLPDGNLRGQGFGATNFESLQSLEAGSSGSIKDVYNHSSYTADQLVNTLTSLMQTYQPAEIHTLANFVSTTIPDHSDHMAAGRFAKRAYQKYENEHFAGKVAVPIRFYVGYPIYLRPANVGGERLLEKENFFMAYARHDPSVCRTLARCTRDPAYGMYLPRQYQNDY